ncbi:hypothetical protein HanXRQr2_Chr09g0375141 [Helianthus annuus]|uniref:Uncharacterized protein n=1 Tax=Helianthus annuus TaxID=4232 RepID=A0A9K3I460_HELAN|nr:hypothetical protein HanXRQr2_Chr09g0375141 [Helianthus annuus]KAJ0892082.1 hypothetical protein HanPSC8_Chr09g0361661 [Helianthus annuus]
MAIQIDKVRRSKLISPKVWRSKLTRYSDPYIIVGGKLTYCWLSPIITSTAFLTAL